MEKRKLLSWIIILFLVLGFVAIYLESEFEISYGIRAGVGFMGIAGILWGIEEIIDHRNFYSFTWQEKERAAVLATIASITTSFLRLLIGIGLVFISTLGFLGLGSQAENFVKNRPGIAMVFLGALAISYGLQQFLEKKKQGRSLQSLLENGLVKVYGVLLMLAGTVVLGLGWIEILTPDGFRNLIQLLLSLLHLPFFLQ